MSTLPPPAGRMPFMASISVDFPAPDGPSSPTNSLGWIESETLSSSLSIPLPALFFTSLVMLTASILVFARVSKTPILLELSSLMRNVPICSESFNENASRETLVPLR